MPGGDGFGNFTFTTNAFYLIRPALAAMHVADFDFLDTGDATYTANVAMADILTRLEKKIFLAQTRLCNKETTPTVSAGSRSITLPAAAFGAEMMNLFYTLAGSYADDVPIPFATEPQGIDRSGYAQNESVQTVPDFWYFDRTRENIVLSQQVPVDTVFRVQFREAPTTYTSSDLGSSSVVYSAIPNQHKETMIWGLCDELALMCATVRALRSEYQVKFAEAMANLTRATANIPAQDMFFIFDTGHGPPRTTLNFNNALIGATRRW